MSLISTHNLTRLLLKRFWLYPSNLMFLYQIVFVLKVKKSNFTNEKVLPFKTLCKFRLYLYLFTCKRYLKRTGFSKSYTFSFVTVSNNTF